MSADLNRCCFIGRLGRDPELVSMKNGEVMTKFSIAVGESYTDKSGEKIKKTEWVNVIAYRKLGEICSKYLTKGAQVYVSGKLSTNKYTGKDGSEKLSVNLILDQMQMLGTKFHQDEKEVTEGVSEPKSDFDDADVPF